MSQPILSRTLPNGLVLVAEPMPWLESAAFTLAVPAGCVHDPADRSGLASFTCELAMRGAGPRDSRRFIEELDRLGVEHGQSVSDGYTTYSGATLAANLPAALELFADVLRRPHMPADQLEPARQVMFQELRAVEDEPSQKVLIELRRRHYPLPWGRPSQGDEAAIAAATLDEIAAHFSARYQPAGTIVGVAGRFDWPALEDLVARLFGDWPPGSPAAIDEQPASRRYEHLPYESNQTQIGISYAAVPYRHEDYFRAWGGVGVLSGGMSSRLFTEVRERRGLCYSVFAMYHTLRDYGGVFCYAGTSAERAQETLDVTLGELARLGQGVEEHELARLKARIKSALVMQQESSSARSAALVRDWYHLGAARTLDEINGYVDALTRQSINSYLAEHPPANFTMVTLGPRELEVNVGVS